MFVFDKAHKLTMKTLTGEQLTDDEAKYLRERNVKYELIRYVYMEKMKHKGSGLTNFHFTPGESFMDTPIIDIVNDLLKFNQAIEDGKVTPLDFVDLDWNDDPSAHKPPHSGRQKTTL
jgi:hypothetical protein